MSATWVTRGSDPERRRDRDRGLLRLVAAVAVGLLAAWAAWAALPSLHSGPGLSMMRRPVLGSATCSVPALAGSVVDVTLTDMVPMMGARGLATTPAVHLGRLLTSVRTVPTGTVSLLVRNAGRATHEVVVMPLAPSAAAGEREVGDGGTVDETSSVAEASRSCGAGAGSGIAAGSLGWVTLSLPRGRYELLCDEPGHYLAGMSAELDVV